MCKIAQLSVLFCRLYRTAIPIPGDPGVQCGTDVRRLVDRLRAASDDYFEGVIARAIS